MRIKSYFAGSVEQAIQQAREELGTEAMLITSRRSSPENRRLGAYEVVFGLPTETAAPAPAAVVRSQDLGGELNLLRAQLEDIKRALQLNSNRATNAAPEGDDIYQELVAADLDPALARQITTEACETWQAAPPAQRSLAGSELLRALAGESLRKRLSVAPEFSTAAQDNNRVVIFTGTPGAGKTTTLTKIAIQKCLAGRMSIRILSVDPHRVASHEKLRVFAGILGIGFTAANTIREFLDAVDEFRSKSLLLVDTPGYGFRDGDSSRDLSACLARMERKEIHLVLPASMRRADLSRSVQQFEEFHPDYLLFTKMDETESVGGIISTAIEANKPLSFFARGQNIPEDLEPASADALIGSVLSRERMNATSAA